MELREFLAQLRESKFYADGANNLEHSFPFLRTHFDAPAFASDLELKRVDLWIGSKSISRMHYDNLDNLFAQVVGSKTFVLAPPDAGAAIQGGKRLRKAVRHYSVGDGCFSKREGLTGKAEGANGLKTGVQSESVLNYLGVDRQNASLATVSVTLRAGDMLYLPFGWWHEVHSHPSSTANSASGGMCASVSHFYTPFYCRPGNISKLGPLLRNPRYMSLWDEIAKKAIQNDEALYEFKARLQAQRRAMSVDLGTPIGALQAQEKTVENLFDAATPSVVYITTFVERVNALTNNAIETPAGTGSGFVWDDEGHNAQSAKVVVTGRDGESTAYNAQLVGFNADKDVAVLQIDAKEGLTPIKIGDSAPLRVGQTTLAIGNPFGLDHTLTVGVVSGLGREVVSPSNRPITGVIQTDAAINPGNSGGALLDSSGRLIGMNTAIYSPSGASAGIGFAIPVDTLKYQVEAIKRYGSVKRAGLGIKYLSGAQARRLGVSRGLLLLDVPKGSSAERAGLRGSYRRGDGDVVLGDIITAIDGDDVRTEQDYFRAIDKFEPGQKVSVGVSRLRADESRGRLIQEEYKKLVVPLQAL